MPPSGTTRWDLPGTVGRTRSVSFTTASSIGASSRSKYPSPRCLASTSSRSRCQSHFKRGLKLSKPSKHTRDHSGCCERNSKMKVRVVADVSDPMMTRTFSVLLSSDGLVAESITC